MITTKPASLFSRPLASRTTSLFRPIPAINRWAIFNRPLNADSVEPTFWAKPLCFITVFQFFWLMTNSRKTDLYARAGITDVAEFYRTKFVSDEVLDARYFK